MNSNQKPETTQKEDIVVTNEKKAEHLHGDNCAHEHGHEHAEQKEDEKQNKGERKVRKAITKLGMVQIPGVNRVTVRQKDSYIFVVKDPEVFKGTQNESTYVIFGELTFEEPDKNIGKETLTKLKETTEGDKVKQEVTEKEEKKNIEIIEDTNEVVSEEGIDQESIKMLTDQFSNVPRNKILKILKKNNNDAVQSILDLQN